MKKLIWIPKQHRDAPPVFDDVGETYYVPLEAIESVTCEVSQTEVDALWLASRLTVNLPNVPENLQQRAAERIQQLHELGIIKS